MARAKPIEHRLNIGRAHTHDQNWRGALMLLLLYAGAGWVQQMIERTRPCWGASQKMRDSLLFTTIILGFPGRKLELHFANLLLLQRLKRARRNGGGVCGEDIDCGIHALVRLSQR